MGHRADLLDVDGAARRGRHSLRFAADLHSRPEGARKYLTFVSHELNNTLAGVLLNLHLLRKQVTAGCVDRDAVGDLLDAATQAVQDTVAAARRFLHAERARGTGGPPDPAPVHLAEVARRMTLQFSAEAAMHGVALAVEVPDDAVVVSNRQLILLVLQNRVGNAVKSSGRGTVRVGADVDELTGIAEALWVSDEGPGIAQEQLDHVFTPVHRGPGADGQAAKGQSADRAGNAGNGIGLAIAAEAAALLGARLAVESRPGAGTTFFLTFPGEGKQ